MALGVRKFAIEGRRLSHTGKTKDWNAKNGSKRRSGQIDDGMTFASTQITLEEYLFGWIASKKVFNPTYHLVPLQTG
jgi:hypothetical protein